LSTAPQAEPADPAPRSELGAATNWLAWALGGLSGIVIVLVAGRSMAVSPDSVTYIAAAESVAAGDGLGTWLEPTLLVFPPAWPLAIAVLVRLGLDGSTAALVLVVASMVCIPPTALGVMRAITADARAQVVGVALTALAPTILAWGFMGLSEASFVLVVLLCVRSLLASRNGSPRLLALAVLLAGLAPLIRYAGVGVPLALGAALLLDSERPRRVLLAAGATVAGLLPIGALALRNLIAYGEPFGERRPSAVGPIGVVVQGLEGLGRSALWGIDAAPRVIEAALGALVVLAVLAIALVAGRSEPVGGRVARLTVAVFALVQWVVMVAGRSRAEIDDLGPRLLAPTAALVVLLGAAAFGDALAAARRPVRILVAIGVGCWCLVALGATARFALRDDVNGYDQPLLVEARALGALDDLPDGCRGEQPAASEGADCVVVANDPFLWFDSPLRPGVTPQVVDSGGSATVPELRDAAAAGTEVYVLWTPFDRKNLVPLAELEDQLGLELVDENRGVQLYRVG
jgi:hypothetical protein